MLLNIDFFRYDGARNANAFTDEYINNEAGKFLLFVLFYVLI